MTNRWIIALLSAFLSVSSLSAQNEGYINFFTVSHFMAQPVTIKTNLGTFTFNDTYSVKGRIESIAAFDINGNEIFVEAPVIKQGSGPYIECYYSFSSFYNNSQKSLEGQDNRIHNPYILSSGKGDVPWIEKKDLPDWRRKLYVSAGYGTQYGGGVGANITGKIKAGLFGASLGIGYDGRPDNNKTPTWYAALLMGIKNWDIEVGIINRYFPNRGYRGLGLTILTNYTIKIYGPIGLNLGVGYTMYGNGKNPLFNFEYSAGLTIRLHQVD